MVSARGEREWIVARRMLALRRFRERSVTGTSHPHGKIQRHAEWLSSRNRSPRGPCSDGLLDRCSPAPPGHRRRRPPARLRHGRGDAEPDGARRTGRRVHTASLGVSDGDACECLVDLDGFLSRDARPDGELRLLSERGADAVSRHGRSIEPARGRQSGRPSADRSDARRAPAGGRKNDARGELRLDRFGVPEQPHGVGRRDPALPLHTARVARRRHEGAGPSTRR